MRTEKRKGQKKTRTPSEILRDREKLLDLYGLCMENVDDLIEEARLLEEYGHYARALFLAMTAVEETGKAQLVADYAEDCVTRDEFNKAFHDHGMKNAYIERKLVLRKDENKFFDGTIKYDVEKGRQLAEWREHALYVSFCNDGRNGLAFSPRTQITRDQCRSAVSEIADYVAYLKHMAEATQCIGSKSLAK